MLNDDQRLIDRQEFLYSSTSLFLYSNVDEALYGTVWYGPLTVAVFTLLSIYVCFDHVYDGKLMNIWTCGYDDTMWSLCLLSYSSCNLGCMAIV